MRRAGALHLRLRRRAQSARPTAIRANRLPACDALASQPSGPHADARPGSVGQRTVQYSADARHWRHAMRTMRCAPHVSADTLR